MIPKIKMLIVDVDGTLTDGGVYVDENGKETKKFNAKDGIGMMEEYRKAMSLKKQPKKIVIIGSGAIGSEFAYFYNSMGTTGTIVEYMDRIVPVEDSEISKELEKSLNNLQNEKLSKLYDKIISR